jgi:threonine synthase
MRDTMRHLLGLRCIVCRKEHGLSQALYVCPSCGNNLEAVYDYRALRKSLTRQALRRKGDRSLWRYRAALPVEASAALSVPQVGWTPLYDSPRLARAAGVRRLYVKDDGRNPSASFKDRANAVVLARALAGKAKVVTTASTGNAASSLACLAAGLPLKTVIFVPETAPEAKIAQLLVFGATVLAVRGTYDDAFDLCGRAAAEYGWYNRSTGVNPFTREGKKTGAYELCEQLDWEVPDLVFVPVGDGNIISGMWKGFVELRELGLTRRLPRLVAVQAAGSAAVKKALEGDGVIRPVSGKTVADSISVSLPRDGEAAVRAVRQSQGFAVAVSDSEILAAIPELARGANVFAEPAAAAAWAGLKKAARAGRVGPRHTVALLVTGNGLKDVASARRSVGAPLRVEPDLASLRPLVRKLRI